MVGHTHTHPERAQPLWGPGAGGSHATQGMTLSEMESVFYQNGVLCTVVFFPGWCGPPPQPTPTQPPFRKLSQTVSRQSGDSGDSGDLGDPPQILGSPQKN